MTGPRVAPGRRALVRTVAVLACLAGGLTGGVACAAPFAYVVNHGDGTVSVLDTASSAVVATVPVGSQPLGAAVHPAGTRVYVTNQVTPNGTVSVLDTATNAVVATVPVGAGPSGVAVKLPGDRVYVTNRDDKTVSVIDTATNAVVATIAVDNNPLGIAIDPSGTPAYVVNKGSNSVSVIDTVANVVSGTIAVGNDPSQVAVAPGGRQVYVSNASNASVSVIDSAARAVVATVAVGSIPEGLVLDPTGAWLYVANSGPNSVSVVDTADRTVAATVDVGFTPFAIGMRPDGARAFVLNRQSADVSVLDTASNTVTDTVEVGSGPAGMGELVVPALRVPRFGADARKCQAALLRQAVKLVRVHHGLEAACRLGVRKAEAAGKSTAEAAAACQRALDPVVPFSKLAQARVRFRAAVQARCKAVTPPLMNGPCDRGATTVSAILDCLVPRHGARVEALADDELAPVYPTPSAAALACQAAIAKHGRRFADRLHKDFAACLEKVLVAAASGKGEAKAVARCRSTLDLASAGSKTARTRAAALTAMAKKCVAVSPSDLGHPCDAGAATMAGLAACVVDEHAADVAKLVAAEANDACVMATRLGLGERYPTICSGS
ncbi:MAG: YncE family protein [Deltaproteobacteria bacterium]|nr:YncE family protein [Deltaproteobacteria bacterium]